jgi:hypothetical protein
VGFISNQWVNRGQGLRNRRYKPVPVSLLCEPSTDLWSSDNQTEVELSARRSNGEMQTVHFSQAEVDQAAPVFVRRMLPEVREQLLVELVGELSREKFLRLLALDLRTRVRLPKP